MSLLERFSPALVVPLHDLTTVDRAWLRVSAWVYPLTDVRESRPVLVTTFDHRGGNYKYRSVEGGDRHGIHPPDL